EQEAIRLVYRDDDLLYLSIHALHKISRYTGKEGIPPTMSKLGSPEWENKKKRIKKQVADIAKELIKLYAKRKTAPGYAFPPDSFLQEELESSFIFEDTPDQAKAVSDVKVDMENPHPMDRLVCGDVGFGKTEVAIRAAFKAVSDGKQVAILVPTTILAMQHHKTFVERLSNFPVKIEYINRFRTAAEIKNTLKEVKEGNVNILIGTHRIVSKDISFKNLGLLIVDEEQKFGVKTKDRLKEMKVNVDVLTLTATPIPRTLHFSLMGARDLSIISTPPPNRQPVTTELHTFSDTLIRDAVAYELKRGGQVFFIHNRVKDIEQVANIVFNLVPDARIGIAHGQMDGKLLEKTMLKFIEGEYDVLVSTNIVESGLDIPNANTIIINHAHNFGLSDLHQMRGRVGRSNRKAFCYLLTPPVIGLSSDARKRLKTLEEFSGLGDGYKVALRDLDIRGAGNMLGAEQSGFINDLGFETYHKILDEAVQDLKENEFKDLFADDLAKIAKIVARECTIETDLEILIPESYISNISERLNQYTTLDNLKNEEELTEFIKSMEDRFGKPPSNVEELFESVRLRWQAQQLGFEKLRIKNRKLRGYFISGENTQYFNSPVFSGILNFAQLNPKFVRLSEYKGKPILDIDNVSNIHEARNIFSKMNKE
ncbi:MAG: transcription-repair coupling factor, partial [Cyclobacteriaceae bacterium]|nr:transcription-repair coupling factor [Cyclobacteriaceae bacterium]